MFQADKVRGLLLEEFVKAQAKNPSYSMRAYAKKVGISQTAISEIFGGKRPITKKSAEKILSGLARSPEEVSNLLLGSDDSSLTSYKSLDMDTFHLISEWHYFAILSLAETKGFQSSAAWIAERLGLTEKIVRDALARLIRLGLIESDKKTGKIKPTGDQFAAISEVATSALKKANRQNLELIEEALESIPSEKRDFTAMTLCFDPDRMDEARKLIKNFRRSFAKVMEAGHKKEVYKICVQFFPLTRSSK